VGVPSITGDAGKGVGADEDAAEVNPSPAARSFVVVTLNVY